MARQNNHDHYHGLSGNKSSFPGFIPDKTKGFTFRLTYRIIDIEGKQSCSRLALIT